MKEKDNIIMTLVNTKNNNEILEKCPNRNVLDLSLVYKILNKSDGIMKTSLISLEKMDIMDMDEEELFQIAKANTERLLPPVFKWLREDFNVVTNEEFIHGATVILYDGQLAKVAEKMNSDLYILPSSIHEVIAIPTYGRTTEMLREIVKDVNQNVVAENEVLSDNVYFYCKETDTLTMACSVRIVS